MVSNRFHVVASFSMGEKEAIFFDNSDNNRGEKEVGSPDENKKDVNNSVPSRSNREDSIVMQALAFMKSSDAKWTDARGQKGPSPSDFGDHQPIPVDSVCLSVVVSDDKED